MEMSFILIRLPLVPVNVSVVVLSPPVIVVDTSSNDVDVAVKEVVAIVPLEAERVTCPFSVLLHALILKLICVVALVREVNAFVLIEPVALPVDKRIQPLLPYAELKEAHPERKLTPLVPEIFISS